MPAGSFSTTVFIAFNPLAGARDPRKRQVVEQLCAALGTRGFRAEVYSDRERLVERAHHEHDRGTLRAVVAAGGDGTASDLVNRTAPSVPIALLPLGTENLLANYLGVPRDPEKVADIIAAGRTVELDAGRANGRLFLLMAGCGFDAEVVRRVHQDRDGHITQWTYAKPILAAVRNYSYPPFRVTCRLGAPEAVTPIEQSFDAHWLFVSNLPSYAGKLCFSPRAVGSDGRLDICAFQTGSSWAGWRYLAAVLLRRHEQMHDCVTAQATHVTIEASRPVPYQLDGDPGGMLPLSIDVLPRRMTVFVPASVHTAWSASSSSSCPNMTGEM
jgi:diacylglycerol kinase family enzyme